MNCREKAFNKILSKISECVSRGVVTTKRPGVRKVPSSIPGRTCFFFSSFLFFFSFPLLLVSILVFVVFFHFFIWLMFFLDLQIFFHIALLQLLAVLQSPSRDPAIHVFLVERFVSLSVPCFFQKVCFLLPICCRAFSVGHM